MSVGDVWDQIVESAWRCGDPGLVFFDTIEKGNMCKHLGKMRANQSMFSWICISTHLDWHEEDGQN